MMQSMKGATKLLGSMNRQMNLPALQRIAMEFERENDIMDQRQEMMDDAIDDVTGLEDEEEGEEVVNQVLDEIGVDLGQSVSVVLIGVGSEVANGYPARGDAARVAESEGRRGESCTSDRGGSWRRRSASETGWFTKMTSIMVYENGDYDSALYTRTSRANGLGLSSTRTSGVASTSTMWFRTWHYICQTPFNTLRACALRG